ncbi:MAG: hypothetical protein ACI9W4_002389 [Rhodothermales bacterium]|jgi:hypothetical protein
MAKIPVSDVQKAAYDRLLATHPEIERKGKNLLYTSVNGHMSTVFSTDPQLGIRLPKAEREAFSAAHNSSILRSYGHNMPEYVTISDEMLDDAEALAPYLELSYTYVTSLKPKPTKKPNPKKKPEKYRTLSQTGPRNGTSGN